MKLEFGELTQRLEVILSVIETDRTKFHEKIASAQQSMGRNPI